jgi:hypothetical protein
MLRHERPDSSDGLVLAAILALAPALQQASGPKRKRHRTDLQEQALGTVLRREVPVNDDLCIICSHPGTEAQVGSGGELADAEGGHCLDVQAIRMETHQLGRVLIMGVVHQHQLRSTFVGCRVLAEAIHELLDPIAGRQGTRDGCDTSHLGNRTHPLRISDDLRNDDEPLRAKPSATARQSGCQCRPHNLLAAQAILRRSTSLALATLHCQAALIVGLLRCILAKESLAILAVTAARVLAQIAMHLPDLLFKITLPC